jgi:hypothetical protein
VATVHFFDLRAAERAVAAVREQHMRRQCLISQHYAAMGAWPPQQQPPPPPVDWPQDDGLGLGLVLGQAVWANFAAGCSLPDGGPNGGSIIVLNCLPDVSLSELRQAFQAYGTRALATDQFSPHPDRILRCIYMLGLCPLLICR